MEHVIKDTTGVKHAEGLVFDVDLPVATQRGIAASTRYVLFLREANRKDAAGVPVLELIDPRDGLIPLRE